MLKEIKFILLFSAALFLIMAAPSYFFLTLPFKYNLEDRYIMAGVLSLLMATSFALAFGDDNNNSRAALFLLIILTQIYLLLLPFSFTNFYAIFILIVLAVLVILLIFLGVVIFQIAYLFDKDVAFLKKLDKWAFIKFNKFYNFVAGVFNAKKLQRKNN